MVESFQLVPQPPYPPSACHDADCQPSTLCLCLQRHRCGPEKGAILESLVARQRPQLALELGTFMGYGAARISRQLPPGGRLITIEAGEEQVTD